MASTAIRRSQADDFRLADFDKDLDWLVTQFGKNVRYDKLSVAAGKLIEKYLVPSGPIDYTRGLFSRRWRDSWESYGHVCDIPLDTALVTPANHKLIEALNAVRNALARFVIDGMTSVRDEQEAANHLRETVERYQSRRWRKVAAIPVMSRKPPTKVQFAAFRSVKVDGMSQTDSAGKLSTSQASISRWVEHVSVWLNGGNELPTSDEIGRMITIDPAKLDIGVRQERLTRRQRQRCDNHDVE